MIDTTLPPEVVTLQAADREAIAALLNDHLDLYSDKRDAIAATASAVASQARLADQLPTPLDEDRDVGLRVAALLLEMNTKTAARSAFWTSIYRMTEDRGFVPETASFEWDYDATDFILTARTLK